VAIEFALVALPVLFVVMAIIEVGIMLIASVTLHGALEAGARMLRTGQIAAAGDETAQRELFKNTVCAELFLTSCADVSYDVRSSSSYGTLSLPPLALDPNTGLPDQPVFLPGGAGEITAARVYTRYTFVTPFLGKIFHDNGNSRLIAYAAIVKGEPWD
jgi:Flp pilus assembly protein TadG